MPAEKSERLERVKEYNLSGDAETRAARARLLARITGRKVTGRVEVDLSQGTPGTVRTRETVKTDE